MKRFSFVIFLIALLPFFSYAHEGHGHTSGYTIIHYLIEPVHLIALVIIAGGILVYVDHLRIKRKKQNKQADA